MAVLTWAWAMWLLVALAHWDVLNVARKQFVGGL